MGSACFLAMRKVPAGKRRQGIQEECGRELLKMPHPFLRAEGSHAGPRFPGRAEGGQVLARTADLPYPWQRTYAGRFV